MIKVSGIYSSNNGIIVQSSGIRTSFYILAESDLRALSDRNAIFRYAGALIYLSEHIDVVLDDEFANIRE
jgi:hypothetical protein